MSFKLEDKSRVNRRAIVTKPVLIVNEKALKF